MKKSYFICLLSVLVAAGFFFLIRQSDQQRKQELLKKGGAVASNSNASADFRGTTKRQALGPVPSRAERAKMTRAERLNLLETLGNVPEDADPREWTLAQETAWWGRELDPKTFWKGKVVWADDAAVKEAHRGGRFYAPPPYTNMALPMRDSARQAQPSGGPESSNIRYAYTASEADFWYLFSKSHPMPPELLERQQLTLGEGYVRHQPPSREPGNEPLGEIERIRRDEAIEQGYPAEAFEPSALFWSYVQKQRGEYQALLGAGHPADSPVLKSFFRKLAVDPKWVVEPLTEEQLQAANAWKIAYLQRLRREKTDESYIQAYLNTWKLSEEQVFGTEQK